LSLRSVRTSHPSPTKENFAPSRRGKIGEKPFKKRGFEKCASARGKSLARKNWNENIDVHQSMAIKPTGGVAEGNQKGVCLIPRGDADLADRYSNGSRGEELWCDKEGVRDPKPWAQGKHMKAGRGYLRGGKELKVRAEKQKNSRGKACPGIG